jgi:hypothetical protein
VTELGGGGGYERGRVFKLSEPEQLDRVVAERVASQRPYVPEPGFARMAKLWGQITGAIADDTGSTDTGLDNVKTTGGLDLADDADETAAVTAKIAAARQLAAQEPDAVDVDPEAWQRVVAERRRQFLEQYADVDIPADDLTAITEMLAAPGGTSTAAVAVRLGKGRTTAHRYLTRLAVAGHAETFGSGRAAGFRTAVPAGPDQAAGDAQ